MKKLPIAEIFASIQGEGIWMGTPSVFVRVSGCNMRCVWCDTPYASWNPEGDSHAIAEVVEKVRDFGIRHVVVTGGEPMMFELVEPLCADLHAAGHTITIETAGTIFRRVTCDLMSISPKLSNSTPLGEPSGWEERHERIRLNRQPLHQLLAVFPNIQLKFVMDPEAPGDRDMQEVLTLLSELNPPVDPGRVLLMPEGIDEHSVLRRLRLLAPLCMKHGFRLAPRLHIDLFGNQRGT